MSHIIAKDISFTSLQKGRGQFSGFGGQSLPKRRQFTDILKAYKIIAAVKDWAILGAWSRRIAGISYQRGADPARQPEFANADDDRAPRASHTERAARTHHLRADAP
jgi:hypothetical protein